MAVELRESFPILEDATASNAGAALSRKAEGAPAGSGGVNYAGMLVGKNPAGNLQFLKLTPSGELVISMEGDDQACVSDEGTIDNGIGVLTTLVEVALQDGLLYEEFEWLVSCFRDVKYVVEGVEDIGVTNVITILAKGRCGPGHYDSHVRLMCRSYTAGTTGNQAARIRAYNPNALSDIDGVLAFKEKQPES